MIRVIAICLFRHNNRILVAEALDTVKHERFARPLGGAVESGEHSHQTILREIREELGHTVTDLQLMGVLENIFTYQGNPGHEIVFVYDGQFTDPSLYVRPELPMTEPGWDPLVAKWRSLDSFGPTCRLVPEGLTDLLHCAADLHPTTHPLPPL